MNLKGKRAAELSDNSKKMCSRCDSELPVSAFALSSMGAFGVTSICKSCRISDRTDDNGAERQRNRELARIEKINSLLAMGPAKSTTGVEDDAVAMLVDVAHQAGAEVRKWHDGTRSDVGIRPIDCIEDCWYPVQVKATAAVKPKFLWNLGGKAYEMPVLLLTGNPEQACILFPEDLARHAEKIKRNSGLIFYGVGAGYWQNALSTHRIVDLVVQLVARWRSERAVQGGGLLAKESTLEMQCTVDSQREWFVSSLSRMFSASKSHSRPIHQSSTDRLEGHVRIQDKSAAWMLREDTPYFKAKCAKLLRGVEVPYVTGDVDLYCFAVVLEQQRLLLEWRIPASVMDGWFGRLSHVRNCKVVKLGRTCINLPVVGPSGENMALHGRIFGRMPRKDTDLRPALFLKIHCIPSTIALPACVCGRDPVPRH
jgi:hypothetical protein